MALFGTAQGWGAKSRGIILKFYANMAKGFKLKVKKFGELIPTFIEVTGGKLVGGFLPPPILDRVKTYPNNFKITFTKRPVVIIKRLLFLLHYSVTNISK